MLVMAFVTAFGPNPRSHTIDHGMGFSAIALVPFRALLCSVPDP
jgi:hypothetical protein